MYQIQNRSPIPENEIIDFPCRICIGKAETEANLGKMMERISDNYSTSQEFEGSHILWLSGEEMGEYDREMFRQFNGYINKIYGTMIFKQKDIQYTIMNQCKRYYSEKYSFHPSSYSLMKEFDLLRNEVKSSGRNKSWIGKPSDGCEGGNIFWFETMEELMAKGIEEGMVAQQYIHNPLTIKNRKWDARIYVIIHGVNPMKGYVWFDTGLARVCTEEYDRTNITNPHSNITNGTRNMDNPRYVAEPEEEEDESTVYHRYPLSRAWELVSENLENPEADLKKMKEGVKSLANSLLRCYRSSIEVEQTDFLEVDGTIDNNDKLFNILGLDIMFDTDLKPWLFETNRNPSMSLTYPMLNEEGILTYKPSKMATKFKCTLINEAARILVGKEDSTKFVKWYDSSDPESGDSDFIYERVFRIFQNVWGRKLRRTLPTNDFIKYTSSLSTELAEAINWEEILSGLSLKNEAELTLPEFFSGLEILAESLSMDLPTYLSKFGGE